MFLTLFLIALSLFSSARAADDQKRLFVFGDSIAMGSYTKRPFALRIGDYCGLQLRNEAVASSTFLDDGQIGRIRRAEIRASDVVIVNAGINDAMIHKIDAAYLAVFERQFSEAVAKLDSSGAAVFIGLPLHVLEKTEIHYPMSESDLTALNRNAEAYVEAIRRVVLKRASPQLHLVESRNDFSVLPDRMFDPVHPNMLGHQKLFYLYREALGATCTPTLTSRVQSWFESVYVVARSIVEPMAIRAGLPIPHSMKREL